jgi:hypothetical protein
MEKYISLTWNEAERILLETGIDKDHINDIIGSINGRRYSHEFVSEWATVPGYKRIYINAHKDGNSVWNCFDIIIEKE